MAQHTERCPFCENDTKIARVEEKVIFCITCGETLWVRPKKEPTNEEDINNTK